MTEMASGTSSEAGGQVSDRPEVIRRGMTMERVYTTPGVHPYDEVTWERRDVVQTNWKTGETVFEQRGVEFPDFWSVISSTIVTTKYFRGAVGTDVREWSLRQLIDRVVKTYTAAGEQHGYFASPADAEAFEHELTWMLLHQVFSFNSPVWFNVGTPSPQQVSACFILAVDDSMASILNWYREEGMIFKGGSGSGLNLSRIRSSKELLSSGGTASGPVSFMRGADASAGTIKSGGATRRAAKMVVLDVDHPDIEEFVETKAREEDKIRALRDAGFDMDLGGKDITSVQYQNANNSVRVSDEFMRAVESGSSFGLRARSDGSVIETVDAKGLFDKIAQAAWECADPGIQYDDTINDWHTCPESGRITASNPCFTGDTLVAVADGRGAVRFDVLAAEERPVPIYTKTDDGRLDVGVLTHIRCTRRDAALVRVSLDDGSSVRCTPDHLFMLRDGSYRAAEELVEGDSLARFDRIEGEAPAIAGENLRQPVGVNHKVIRVEACGSADVFDGEVPGTHNFAIVTTAMGDLATGDLSGVFVHNCSEYMHLDNTSCNLASLNLMKFLREDDTFDAVTFGKVVEIVITAMDISICFADFPTEAIGDNTRKFRQLGIGYANLGALLMASGLPYDSDAGRALAAAITSLMTGTAYKRSAELAAVVGPYEGYARNAEAHKRVMRKHAAANDSVRTFTPLDKDVHDVATAVWADVVALGEANGYRNSQASVLAPTGCLTGDTLVTTDRGLSRLSELGDVWGDRWQPLDATVSTDAGPQQATQFFVNGEEPTRRIVTAGGYRIRGTLTHRVKVVDPVTGEWGWKRLAEVQPDDVVPIQLGTMVGEPRRVPLPVLDQATYAGDRHTVVPEAVDASLAELVGYFMGDGSLHAKGVRLCVADTDLDVVERILVLSKELFHLEPTVTQQQGYQEVTLSSVRLARWWQAAGFAKQLPQADHSGKGWTPHVPWAIRETNDREVYAAFLRGLFEADGAVSDGVPSLSTASSTFADDVRALLLVLGYPTTTRETVSGWGGPQFQVRVRDVNHAVRFGEQVGFWSARKAARLASEHSPQSGNRDRILLPAAVWLELCPVGSPLSDLVRQAVSRGKGLPRDLARSVLELTGDERVRHALGYVYETVAANEDGGVQATFDLSVPANVTYVAAGFVSHNTIGLMMDCDTTGIEPDLALVKFKKMVGGGSLQIVNNTVPRALRKLGYTEETIEAIVEHIAQHGNVVDAPGLKSEHYPIFDCAMGARTIAPMGHVRMMAATQPFLSGAISKCVTGDSLVATTDGLVRIGSWWDGEAADSFRDHVVEVASLGGTTKTDAFYYGGLRPTRRAVLRSGHRVVGTPNHRVLVAGDHGIDWRELSELTVGDHVAVRYGDDLWSATPASLRHISVSPRYGSQKTVNLPEEMSGELAFLLGAYASEGHTTLSTWTVTITNSQQNVLERVQAAWQSVFGLSAQIVEQPGKCPGVVVASKTVVEFLRSLGCGERAANKRIPDVVLRSPKAMVLAFLQGLALDAFVTVDATCKWAICVDSPGLLDDLQAVLTNLGIVHGRVGKLNRSNGKTHDEVYACGAHAVAMIGLVPFLESDKAARAAQLTATGRQQSTADVVPGISGRDLYELLPAGQPGRSGAGTGRQEFSFLLDPRTLHVSRRTLERVAALPGVNLPQWLRTVLSDNLHFTPVAEVVDDGPREVYDVSVPSTHAFVANGIVNHNTVNMPESATVDEIEEIYFQGWKLGLKALAIYRDNCKVGQPLSDAKGASKDNGAKAEQAPAVEYRPIRKRLPKNRPATTTSFSVGGAEGYMTASRYPDDGLGEIFLKMSKQGSTLAGMMDAFSIAVSIGLQYGVPLETFVQKFVNMRFDPAGLTDDADVRMAQSIMDYIFRRLALEYLPYESRAGLGIYTAEERTRYLETGSYEEQEAELGDADLEALAQSAPVVELKPEPPHAAEPVPTGVHSSTELLEALQGTASDAPMCFTCGTKMRPAGSCYVCEGCGATSGCS